MIKKRHKTTINPSFFFLPSKTPQLKDPVAVGVRLVSHCLDWCPATNPYFAANTQCQFGFCSVTVGGLNKGESRGRRAKERDQKDKGVGALDVGGYCRTRRGWLYRGMSLLCSC